MSSFPCNGAQLPERPDNVFFIDPILANAKFNFIVWSPSVWGVWTHYHDYTTACYENHDHCVEGHDPQTLRFKGYVFGYHTIKVKACFLQLTPASIRAWWEQVPEGSTLRGMQINVSRGAKKNSPLKIIADPYAMPDPSRLRPDLTPRASIYHMWKQVDPGWKWSTLPMRCITDFRDAV